MFTPTTGDMERIYEGVRADQDQVMPRESHREFDRWLARHDAEVAVKALREAAGRIPFESGELGAQPNRAGIMRWLDARADRIERKAGI